MLDDDTKRHINLFCSIFGALCLLLLIATERSRIPSLAFNEAQTNFWSTVLKGVVALVAAVGGFITISKYLSEKRKENQNALLVAQAPFFAKRQEVYYFLVSATADIGIGDPKARSRRVAEYQFWHLFWGALPLVADRQVSIAVDAFAESLYPTGTIGAGRRDDVRVRNASMNLARACRNSLGFAGPDVSEATLTAASPFSGVAFGPAPAEDADEESKHIDQVMRT